MRFSDQARAGYPNIHALDEFEQAYDRAVALKVPVVRASDISPVAKIPLKVTILIQVGLRRSLELAEPFVRDVNDRLFAPAYVAARAMLETAVLLWDVSHRVEQITANWEKPQLEDFDERIMKALLGAKTSAWVGDPQQFQAVNMLTIVDRVTRQLGPDVRSFYDALSEHAHPNYSGMLGSYQRPDPNRQESIIIDKPAQEKAEALVLAVNGAISALGILLKALAKYEATLYEFTRLCEEAIHDGGTWPPGLQYPVHPPRV